MLAPWPRGRRKCLLHCILNKSTSEWVGVYTNIINTFPLYMNITNLTRDKFAVIWFPPRLSGEIRLPIPLCLALNQRLHCVIAHALHTHYVHKCNVKIILFPFHVCNLCDCVLGPDDLHIRTPPECILCDSDSCCCFHYAACVQSATAQTPGVYDWWLVTEDAAQPANLHGSKLKKGRRNHASLKVTLVGLHQQQWILIRV